MTLKLILPYLISILNSYHKAVNNMVSFHVVYLKICHHWGAWQLSV